MHVWIEPKTVCLRKVWVMTAREREGPLRRGISPLWWMEWAGTLASGPGSYRGDLQCNRGCGDALEVADNGDSREWPWGRRMDGGRKLGLDQAPMDHPLRTLSPPRNPPHPTTATRVEWIKEGTIVVAPFTTRVDCTKRRAPVVHHYPVLVQSSATVSIVP